MAVPTSKHTGTSALVPVKDLSTWLTRQEVADLTSVSYGTVTAWEKSGLLTPEYRAREGQGPRSVPVYDPRQVVSIPRRKRVVIPDSPDELTARSFEMFEMGLSLAEIVIATRTRLETIEDLHARWLDVGGADLVLTPKARESLSAHLGPFDTVAELVERVREAFAAPTLAASIDVDVIDGSPLARATDREIDRGIVAVLDRVAGVAA